MDRHRQHRSFFPISREGSWYRNRQNGQRVLHTECSLRNRGTARTEGGDTHRAVRFIRGNRGQFAEGLSRAASACRLSS